MTLPMLRQLGKIPPLYRGSGFYLALLTGFMLQLWAGWEMATPKEQQILKFLLPAIFFFPGLLNADVLLSGNIAYLLYGLVLAAAVPGWKRNNWNWFYVAVLLSSCCKAPLLTLLALPALFGRGQRFRAGIAGALGTLLFACQSLIWPRLFSDFLRAVDLQFEWNHDFGFGPAGLLGEELQSIGVRYTLTTEILYAAFAATVLTILLFTIRRTSSNDAARMAWLPAMLVGTVLLNPRIKEYDVAALTIPMLLIAFRFISLVAESRAGMRSQTIATIPGACAEVQGARVIDRVLTGWTRSHLLVSIAGWFLAVNFAAAAGLWKPVEFILLLSFFIGGTWTALTLTESTLLRSPFRTFGLGKSGKAFAVENSGTPSRLS
jgi:hypothetical protein